MKNFSLLLVDSKGEASKQIANSIKKSCLNLRVNLCNSGREAFFFLKDNLPSAILIDFMLADIDGLEFLSIISEANKLKNTPVLVMSGTYTEPADRTSALFAGARSFITKPNCSQEKQLACWGQAFCRELAYQLGVEYEPQKALRFLEKRTSLKNELLKK